MNLLEFKKLKTNKKGQIQNYLAIVMFLFAIGFISILSSVLVYNMNTAIYDAGYNSSIMTETGAKFFNATLLYDKIIVMFLIALLIGIGITSYKLNTAPMFFILSVIAAAFMGFVSYFFNALFQEIVSQSVFNTVLVYFPMTILICTNMHWIALVAFIIGSIALYGKKPTETLVQR